MNNNAIKSQYSNKEKLDTLIFLTVKELYGIELDPTIDRPKDESYGDYSTSIAFVLAPRLKRKPLEIAREISQTINLTLKILRSNHDKTQANQL